jgi:hypothetical protein
MGTISGMMMGVADVPVNIFKGKSKDPQAKQDISMTDAIGAGKGIAKIVDSGIKSPMDFTLSLAKGFHNAPKLYGDTVRPHERVSGLESGLRAAGKVGINNY